MATETGTKRPRSRRPRTDRLTTVWMLLALAGAVTAIATRNLLPHTWWTTIHLVTLGVLTNGILQWSWYFARGLLRLPPNDRRSGRDALIRSLTFNAALVGLIASMWAGAPAVVIAFAATVGAVVAWHGLAIVLAAKHALGSRHAPLLRFYVAASALFVIGCTIAGFLTVELLDPHAPTWLVRADDGLALAHAIIMVGGWLGLTIAGTLVTLGPTVLRTRMEADASAIAVRGLPWLAAAVAAAGTSAALGWMPAAGALLGALRPWPRRVDRASTRPSHDRQGRPRTRRLDARGRHRLDGRRRGHHGHPHRPRPGRDRRTRRRDALDPPHRRRRARPDLRGRADVSAARGRGWRTRHRAARVSPRSRPPPPCASPPARQASCRWPSPPASAPTLAGPGGSSSPLRSRRTSCSWASRACARRGRDGRQAGPRPSPCRWWSPLAKQHPRAPKPTPGASCDHPHLRAESHAARLARAGAPLTPPPRDTSPRAGAHSAARRGRADPGRDGARGSTPARHRSGRAARRRCGCGRGGCHRPHHRSHGGRGRHVLHPRHDRGARGRSPGHHLYQHRRPAPRPGAGKRRRDPLHSPWGNSHARRGRHHPRHAGLVFPRRASGHGHGAHHRGGGRARTGDNGRRNGQPSTLGRDQARCQA